MTGPRVPGGSFTLDGGQWLDSPPARSDLTVAQLCDLLALALAGCPLPARYGYRDGRDVLSDLSLVVNNETGRLRDRLQHLDAGSLSARVATSGAWRLLWDAGKRKTIRTDDLRAVLLEEPRPSSPHPDLPGPASSLPGPGGESVVLAGGAPRQGGADEGGAA